MLCRLGGGQNVALLYPAKIGECKFSSLVIILPYIEVGLSL